MCAVAPTLPPGLAGAAPVTPCVPATTPANVEGAPAALRADVEALRAHVEALRADFAALRADIEALRRGRAPTTAGPTFLPMAAAVDPPIPAASLAPVPVDDDNAAPAPRSEGEVVTTTTIKKTPRRPQGFEYDASIDAALRAMERDPEERQSPDYLSGKQAGEMTKADRADLIEKMHDFSKYHCLAAGTVHRAVSYVDRFLSARKIGGDGGELYVLGAAAVFAAAKYEDQDTLDEIDADDAADLAGCSRDKVLAAERELVAALGYRLGGPTAHTFVDHLTRHGQEEEDEEVRALAHHLADMAVLDYRSVAALPSAVAAAAIAMARLALDCSYASSYGLAVAPVAGYTLEEEDMSECVGAIYDMHECMLAWPGCGLLMAYWEGRHYDFPPRSRLTGLR